MANNRLQIYCKKCFELIIIAKYYPCVWYCGGSNGGLSDFLTRHSRHFSEDEIDVNWGNEMFGMRSEGDSEKDGFKSDYRERPYKLIRE